MRVKNFITYEQWLSKYGFTKPSLEQQRRLKQMYKEVLHLDGIECDWCCKTGREVKECGDKLIIGGELTAICSNCISSMNDILDE